MNFNHNIRRRRRRLGMTQQALSRDTWARSYISQIELGKVVSPLETLVEIANRLDVTAGELLGDDVMIQAAKETLFTAPKLCRKLLAEAPMTTTAQVLLGLVEAYETAALPDKPLVYDSELYFLTAKVMMENGSYDPAAELLKEALRFSHPLWKIRLLGQLLVCYRKLNDEEAHAAVTEQLDVLLGGSRDLEGLYSMLMKEIRTSDVDSVPADLVTMATGLRWARDMVEVLEMMDQRRLIHNCKEIPEQTAEQC